MEIQKLEEIVKTKGKETVKFQSHQASSKYVFFLTWRCLIFIHAYLYSFHSERESFVALQDLPISRLLCERKDLRYRPPVPKNLPCLSKRQPSGFFDAAQRSPLLQEYLGVDTKCRRPMNIRITKPVRWCESGGVETYRRATSSLHPPKQSYRALYEKDLNDYRRVQAETMKQLHKDRREIIKERKKVMSKKGTIAFERYCLDLVAEINNNKWG